MEYIVTANAQGKDIYLARRQNTDKALLQDSLTTDRRHAFRWSGSEFASCNLADAERFIAHAEQYAPLGWHVVEA